MSDTPKTDALREVVIGQYKEDELTGDGMGNILSALTDIETLERERDEWAELWADLSRASVNDICRLERERDAERALADRLAGALEMVRDADDDCHKDGLQTIPSVARHKIDLSLAAWKEDRSE